MNTELSRPARASDNKWAQVGILLSAFGLLNLFFLGPMRLEPVRYMTLCSLLGLMVSLVGLFRQPRKLAVWGVVLGAVGSMFLPTVFLPVLIHG